jgi:hypothetical protein
MFPKAPFHKMAPSGPRTALVDCLCYVGIGLKVSRRVKDMFCFSHRFGAYSKQQG